MNDGQQCVVMAGGTSFLSLLCILLIGLKLTGFIVTPWYLVLAPMWVPWALAIPFIFLVGWWASRR